MPTFDAASLKDFSEKLFLAAGANAEEADITATSLVQSNLLGHDSHGVIRVIQYVRLMREGKIVPGNRPEILIETATTFVMDGHWTFGQVIVRRAMEHAIQKAKAGGVVQFGIRCANHIGRLGEYTQQAADAGLVSLMVANNSGAGRVVAPFGGAQGRLATNPISFAAPWKGDQPLVLDMTSSIAPEGKVRVMRNKGELLPEGWILDAQGRPSRNPADLYGPPWGALLPLGGPMGHKGFGLALMVEILGGLLSGAGVSRPDANRLGNGVFAFVFDVEAFMPRLAYEEQVSDLMDYVRSCPTQPGVKEILIPGEPEHRTKVKRQAEGIPIDVETWRQLTELAGQLGIERLKD